MIPSLLIADLVLDSFDIDFWEAVIDDISSVKIDSPSDPFLNLS